MAGRSNGDDLAIVIPEIRDSIEDRNVIMEAKGRQIRDTVCLEFSDWPFAGRNEVLIQ